MRDMDLFDLESNRSWLSGGCRRLRCGSSLVRLHL